MSEITAFTYIDKYCERLFPGIWGEPLNLISNLAFIIAAFYLLKYVRTFSVSVNRNNWDIYLLITLLFVIGAGSALWHALAVQWALYADAIPILIFINVYLLSCSIRLLNFSFFTTIVMFVLFHLVNFGFNQLFPKDYLNGSIFYAPVYLYLLPILAIIWHRNLQIKTLFLFSVVLFGISLVFRTVDEMVCGTFPFGTHFVWHVLNAIMIYYFVKALIDVTFNIDKLRVTVK